MAGATGTFDVLGDVAGIRRRKQAAADRAKLAVDDVITALDGKAIENVEELRALLQEHQAGDEVTLSILRDGEQMEITVTLAERS